MSQPRFNTSNAVRQPVDIYNFDQLPLSLKFTDANSAPIDLTNVKFEFYLQAGKVSKKTYTIDKNQMTATYLAKTGADKNELNMQAMFEDIRDTIVPKLEPHELVQVVTDADDYTYVQVVYQINAGKY